jgi:hypothetical protein
MNEVGHTKLLSISIPYPPETLELSLQPLPSAIWHEGQAIFVGEGNEDRFCKEWGAKRIYLGERR